MAALPVELHEEAVDEAREARFWYADRSFRAAVRFREELDNAIAKIHQSPLRWPKHLHGTRRYRFSFGPWNIHEGADPFGQAFRFRQPTAIIPEKRSG